MRGNILCLLALVGCIPLVLYLFSRFKAERAAILAFFGALMFLPMEELPVPVILYTKMTATAIGVMLAIVVFDSERLGKLTFHPVDIPMVLWIISGFLSSVANDLGAKDGLQEAFNTFTLWGVPYLVGRLYFSNPLGMDMLCRALFAAGLIYVPFVLFELKMSPQSHAMVYGYMQHSFAQVIRGGGYRPMVFMEHGIMLGMWMAMAALVGVWCTYTKAFPKKMWQAPTVLLALVLMGTAIAIKSSGAIGLFLLGLLALFVTAKARTTLVVWLMLLIPAGYVGTRATGYWDGQNLVDFISEKFSPDRAASLQFRFENENILVEKALERPLLGWGGWGRSRVFDEETGEDISVTDGFWVIALGTRGYLGLFSVSLVLLLPTLLFLLRCPARLWEKKDFSPTAVLSIIPLLFMIDCMLNDMLNQGYIIFVGATAGMLATYGIASLESRASASEAEDLLPTPSKIAQKDAKGLPLPGTRAGALHGHQEIRPLTTLALSADSGAFPFRMGLLPMKGEESLPRCLGGATPVSNITGPGRQDRIPVRAPGERRAAYQGPRMLAHPLESQTEFISHRTKTPEVLPPIALQEEEPREDSQKEAYVHKGEKWFRRF